MLTLNYFNNENIDISSIMYTSANASYPGDMDNTNGARAAALMAFCKEINPNLKLHTPAVGVVMKYNGLSRSMNANAIAQYTDNILSYMRSYSCDNNYKIENNKPYYRVVLQHITFRNVGTDARAAVIQQLQNYEYQGHVLVEHKELRTMLTLNPSHDIHVFTITDTSAVIIVSNLMNNTISERCTLAAAQALGYGVDEETANLILQSDSNVSEMYFAKQCKELQETLQTKRILNSLPTLTELLLCCTSKSELENALTNRESEYSNYMSTARMLLKEITKLKREIILANGSTVPTELIEHITAHEAKNILSIERYNEHCVRLNIRQPLIYWYEEDFDILYENIEQNELHILSEKELEFFKDIIKNRTVTLLLDTTIRLTNDNGFLDQLCRKDDLTYNTMCNPHLYHYNCWGDNGPLLMTASKDRDFLGYWFLLKTTLSSINLADGPVFRRFVQDFRSAIRNQWRVLVLDKEGNIFKLANYFNDNYNRPKVPVSAAVETEPVDTTPLEMEDTIIGGIF